MTNYDAQPFLLGILVNGTLANADELPNENGTPTRFDSTKAARDMGRALLDRHPDAIGFTVAKTFNAGHYRTVWTEGR